MFAKRWRPAQQHQAWWWNSIRAANVWVKLQTQSGQLCGVPEERLWEEYVRLLGLFSRPVPQRERKSSLKYAFPHPTESSVFLPITSTSLLPHQPCIIHPQSIHPPLGPMLAEKRFSLFYYLKSVPRSLSILLSLFLAFSVFLYLSASPKTI